MADNKLPTYFDAPRQKNNISIKDIPRMIVATADINALAGTVAEAYRLTVSLERDIVEIKARYSALEKSNRQFHEEMMAALAGRFAERAATISFIREAVTNLIAEKQFDIAHAIIGQLTELLRQSPLDEAFSIRNR
ncbi:MAG: hypothetical protein ACK5TQ_01450 [Acetobacteraceae bacterium]